MRNLFLSILVIILFELLIQSCANPGAITGGPKDSIPPTLLESTPENQTINFKGQTFTLTFDEFVNADKLQQSLIITPITDNRYKHRVKKRTVIIQFEEPFEDSTTYTLNFFDGITDITEKNPAENLILAFSTGTYIDSLEVYGSITNLFSNDPAKKITVGLYRITDSLNIFTDKPTYFINSDQHGAFHIQNIKQNDYRLLAFQDENKNLLFDPKETYAFLADTLFLDSTITDSLRLKSLQVNAAKLKLLSSRPSTRYFELRYSKPITSYSISDSTKGGDLASDFTNEKQSIQFYNNLDLSETDSLLTIVSAFDSLGNQSIDTVFVKFRSSTRKFGEYTYTLNPPKSIPISSETKFSLSFNKPTHILDSSFLVLQIDTLYEVALHPQYLQSNFNQTSYAFTLPDLNAQFIADTLAGFQKSIIGDSTDVDSTDLKLYNKLDTYPTNRFMLKVLPGCFISVEKDTTTMISNVYTFSKKENFGTIKIQLTTEKSSYFVQLMKGNEPIKTLADCTECAFTMVPAGNYWIRILIDENQDGKWSIGNILQNIEPEKVVYFPEQTTIRTNWENQLEYSF